ncbi:unnamed protein product [Toxocara canis]|uniref:Tudor domain-containing protein n=1 Tax=Toxocara canis TaxID=6265 RepID=A0A183VD20_TOXCA|nr:unnamed protein product [Toxocara canis]
MRRSRMTRERFFALNQFDGIIYACTKTAKIESIYSPQFGVIVVESDTKPIENRIRPLEGNSCKFSAYYKEGRWYANRITVMSSPPLQLERKPDRCVMKGIAVVCGVHETIAWLWSDILGRVLVKQELAKDLSSLTCVEFRAMKCSIREPSVGYEAVSVTVMNEKVFLSEILRFKGSVTVEENGLARINEQLCVLLVDDSRAEEPLMRGAQLLPAGSKASLLYFEHYDGNADELVSVFITQKSKIVEGIALGLRIDQGFE